MYALQGLDVDGTSAEQCKKLVGIGTGGASANTAVHVDSRVLLKSAYRRYSGRGA